MTEKPLSEYDEERKKEDLKIVDAMAGGPRIRELEAEVARLTEELRIIHHEYTNLWKHKDNILKKKEEAEARVKEAQKLIEEEVSEASHGYLEYENNIRYPHWFWVRMTDLNKNMKALLGEASG